MDIIYAVPLAVLAGGALGWFLNTRLGGSSLEAAKVRADGLLRTAQREGRKARQASVLEAQQEIGRLREKSDLDLRNRKRQAQKQERDLRGQHRSLAEQSDKLKLQEEALHEREGEHARAVEEVAEARRAADALIEEQNRRLERVSGMTQDEARRRLEANLKAQVRFESARMIKEIRDEAQRNADKEATKILALAVERAASEFSAERTVTQFPLPKAGELKGRIIGHEGKNIRAFEAATGIQLIVDEENETVSLSGYNPVGREIARRVLEKLVRDGNIHPKRIEELARRARKRLDEEMKKAGRDTLKELKLQGVDPEIVLLLGRLKFRTSYGQNVLQHSKEVAYLTGMMAAELRLDEKLARRAGLLHDIGKAIDYEQEGTHPEIGAEIGQRCGEDPRVVNAIASHHEDCEVLSPYAVLVMAADALSGARPGARRKSVAEYIQRIEQLEDLANTMKGVEQSYALHAGREIRVIAKSNMVDDARTDMLARDLAGKIQSEMDYPGKIKVTVIRETRAVEVAH
jgi:ribonuclease Y